MSESRIQVYGVDTTTAYFVPLTVTAGALIVNVAQISGNSAPGATWGPVFGSSNLSSADVPTLGALPWVLAPTYNSVGGVDFAPAYAQRGNATHEMFTSQVRNGNQVGPVIINPNWNAASFFITIAALANPITFILEANSRPSFTGVTQTILTSTAIAVPGSLLLEIAPFKAAVANLSVQMVMPLYTRLRYTTTGNATVQVMSCYGIS
jgi:hypothetical protein